MPTLECLDERSKAILDKLEDMDRRYSKLHADVRFSVQEINKTLSQRIDKIEEDISQIRLSMAIEEGKKTGAIWAGGIALTTFSAFFGAVGNMIYTWMIGPHGPLR